MNPTPSNSPAAVLRSIEVVSGPTSLRAAYDRLLRAAKVEVLVMNRPPYTWEAGNVDTAVIEALARGVEARALYEASEVEDPGAEVLRQEIAAYHAAGVRGRIVSTLPLKLAVLDRTAALVVLEDANAPEETFPSAQLIVHAGYASALASTFEHYWAQARPYGVPVGKTPETLGVDDGASPSGHWPADQARGRDQ